MLMHAAAASPPRWTLAVAGCLLLLSIAWTSPAHGVTQPGTNACELDRYSIRSARYTTQGFRFPSAPQFSLGGCLYRPTGHDLFPVVILVAGSGDQPIAAGYMAAMHANALAARGIGVFAFNKRGTGDSGGKPTGSDFAERGRDVAAAVRFVKSLPSTTGVGLWGVSQAGWVIPQALRKGDGVSCIV